MISEAIGLLAAQTNTSKACALLGKPRGSHYRDRQPATTVAALLPAARASPPNALTTTEQDAIIAALTSPRCQVPGLMEASNSR